jgi:hypothetical protein
MKSDENVIVVHFYLLHFIDILLEQLTLRTFITVLHIFEHRCDKNMPNQYTQNYNKYFTTHYNGIEHDKTRKLEKLLLIDR